MPTLEHVDSAVTEPRVACASSLVITPTPDLMIDVDDLLMSVYDARTDLLDAVDCV